MSNEYYSAVYTWFEKCGIISNIRTHLRQNLVSALKGKSAVCKAEPNVPKSAKQYVYDLLIAEYLWNYDYAYTLSVFASEAPLLINFCDQMPKAPADTNTSSRPKLKTDYIWHTLETLGIKPCKSEGQRIVSEYAESDSPLLLCILKCVPSGFLNTVAEKDIEEGKSMRSKRTQTDHVDSSDSLESKRLQEAQRRLLEQKESFDAQLKKRECELRTQTVLMERQILTLYEKLEQAQNLMQAVDAKEKRLVAERKKDAQLFSRKELELSLKEKYLLQESNRLQKQRDGDRRFEDDMKKLQEELAKVKKELPGTGSNSSIRRDVQVQTDIGSRLADTEEIRMLNREKQELTSLIREQHSRIEELTLRAVQLSRQLEELQLLRSTEIPERVVHKNTLISESSSTEDILQDAKMRLRRLEEESLKADQYYYNCIMTSP